MNRTRTIFLSIIFLYAVVVRLVLIDRPFTRNAEGTGAYYGVLARNFLRCPLSVTHGVPVQSVNTAPGEPVTFYPNHPPLVPMLIAGSYSIFGENEWQTRLPTALFTLGCLALLYCILSRYNHPIAGLFAAALFATMPMTIMYGGHPDCINTQLMFFILLTIFAYERFQHAPTLAGGIWMALAFLPAAYTDWPAYYVVPVVCGHFALTRSWKKWWPIVPFGLYSIVLFVLAYGQIAMTIHDWRWMGQQLERRTISSESDRASIITQADWFRGILTHNLKRHTLPVLILAGTWIVGWAWRIRAIDRGWTFARLALGYAFLHVLVGRQGVLVHEWWWWPVTPALAIASGLTIESFWNRAFEPTLKARRVGAIVMAALLGAFATWTTLTTFPTFYDRDKTLGALTFSPAELGEAVRLAAPKPTDCSMVAFNDTYDLPVWFYGDRVMKLNVWDQLTFETRLDDGVGDLAFGYKQTSVRRPVGFVFPKQFLDPNVEQFVRYLKSSYASRESEKFLIFDLTRSPTVPVTLPP